MSFTSSTIFTVISFLLIAVVFHNDNSAVFVVRGFSPSTTTTRHQNHHDSNISRHISIIALNAESDNNKMDETAAKALTEFMAKAHDEKLRAIADVESKSKGRIQELEAEVKDLKEKLESGYSLPKQTSAPSSHSSGNSYEFPATNKELGVKLTAYRTFLKDYLVSSQKDKYEAVKTAENKMKGKYEAIIADLEKQIKE